MRRIVSAFLMLLSYSGFLNAQESRITIVCEGVEQKDTNKYALLVNDYDAFIFESGNEQPFVFSNKSLIWSLSTDTPVVLSRFSRLPFLQIDNCPLQPGDSICIKSTNDSLIFTGRGSKIFEFQYKLNKEINNRKLDSLKKQRFKIDFLDDFIAYKCLLESSYNKQYSILNDFRKDISQSSFLYLRDNFLNQLRFFVSQAFLTIVGKSQILKLTNQNLVNIYDSVLLKYHPDKNNVLDTLGPAPFSIGLRSYAIVGDLRKSQFEINNNELERRISRYYYAKENFGGNSKVRALLDILVSDILKKSTEQDALKVANDFLNQNHYPKYVKYLNDYLDKQMAVSTGKIASDFTIKDNNNNPITLADFKGKTVFMDFWFTGCKGCVQMAEALKIVEKTFEGNPNVVFLSVSTDKSKEMWINSIAKAKYTTGSATNAFTDGLGRDHQVVKNYNITSYPAIFLITPDGKFVKPVPDPRNDKGKKLTALIRKMLPSSKADGPYVLYKSDKIISRSIEDSSGRSVVKEIDINITQKKNIALRVQADGSTKKFEVKLKDVLNVEQSLYKQPEKLLAVSDIEGNFYPFVELLQANKVIDSNFNWTFGNGHLVLNGDFFDRGHQVTEILWLIYSIEEKAKAMGGYVHFILGNHEIMNLTGDLRYVHTKYMNTSKLLKENYTTELYGENSELGRWLRTKNIVEKIGDVLFLHGGISQPMNELSVTIDQINMIARPYYDKSNLALNGTGALSTIMSSQFGPFWYRGYYKDKNVTIKQIDSTLNKFDVSRIVTGHTIINSGERLSTYFDGKIINLDTHHAEGKSEALFIEKDKYYRVDMIGNKSLLTDNADNNKIASN